LATQGYGAEMVDQLPDGCSILLIHGTADEVLHYSNSRDVYGLAHEPKQLILYPAPDMVSMRLQMSA
ncbi:MAG: hypothetical protein C4293_13940, partial [Nitrospiraceae bacterium]